MTIESDKLVNRYLALKDNFHALERIVSHSLRYGILMNTDSLLTKIEKELKYFVKLPPKKFLLGEKRQLRLENQVLKYELKQALDGMDIPRLTARIISEQREEIEVLQRKVRELERKNAQANNRTAV